MRSGWPTSTLYGQPLTIAQVLWTWISASTLLPPRTKHPTPLPIFNRLCMLTCGVAIVISLRATIISAHWRTTTMRFHLNLFTQLLVSQADTVAVSRPLEARTSFMSESANALAPYIDDELIHLLETIQSLYPPLLLEH